MPLKVREQYNTEDLFRTSQSNVGLFLEHWNSFRWVSFQVSVRF